MTRVATHGNYQSALLSLMNAQGRAQQAQEGARLYSSRLSEIMSRFLAAGEDIHDPFLTPRVKSKRALVLMFTSDRGLCGSFNNQIAKKVVQWMMEARSKFERVDVSFCGRRGYNALKNRVKVRRNYEGVTNKPSYADARRISARNRASSSWIANGLVR